MKERLNELLPCIHEANEIAVALKRDIKFNMKIVGSFPDFGNCADVKKEQKIKVENKEVGYYYLWDPHSFMDRLEIYRANHQEYDDCI